MSGHGDEDLRKAIAAGINIVHINTEHGDVAYRIVVPLGKLATVTDSLIHATKSLLLGGTI
jgi:hypothetical protein